MIYKPKGRKYYVVDFQWNGQRIQRRTRMTNQRDALAIEAAIRTELERGNYGILHPKPKPTLGEFLKRDFLPHVESRFREATPKTFAYYNWGCKMLLESDLAALRLNELTDQQASRFAARYSRLKPTTINCGLRTLRRAVYLAVEWGKIERRPKITLAKGERQRDRVLTRAEAEKYLTACPEPWRDCATLMLATGMRPHEIFKLRWEHVLLNGSGGLI